MGAGAGDEAPGGEGADRQRIRRTRWRRDELKEAAAHVLGGDERWRPGTALGKSSRSRLDVGEHGATPAKVR